MFKITLHQDDEAVLKYIKDKLEIGGVRYYKKECIFNVTDKEGIALLISIFDKYNLNTTKHLDFLAWKEANLLVVKRGYRTVEGSSILINLKSSMNTNRTYFNWKHLEDFKKL